MDVANLSVLLLGIALIFQLLAANRLKGGLTQRYGKVQVEGIELPELLVAFFLVAFFWWQVQSAGAVSTATGDSETVITTSRLVFSSIIHLFFLFGVVVYLALYRGKDLVEFFGLTRIHWKKALLWTGVAGVVSTFLVMGINQVLSELLLNQMIGENQGQETLIQLQNSNDPIFIFAMIISACIIAPIWEEAVFRGYLYPVIKRFSQPLLATIVVSALFAAVHNDAFALVPLICLATILCVTYELTGSLWVPIGIHAVFNALNMAFTMMSQDLPGS